jgi:3-deoxy-7-phosphoheptulonate synthase
VILRGGGRTGPNYDREHVLEVCRQLNARGLRESVMIDCSHGNSEKNHLRQASVADSIVEQVASGSWRIIGTMLESHLVEGRQEYVAGSAVYGQSITDACISLEQTEPILERLAVAQQHCEKRDPCSSTHLLTRLNTSGNVRPLCAHVPSIWPFVIEPS